MLNAIGPFGQQLEVLYPQLFIALLYVALVAGAIVLITLALTVAEYKVSTWLSGD